MKKTCTNCLTVQLESEFFYKNKKAARRHSICKTCKRENDRIAYEKSDIRKGKIRLNARRAIKRAAEHVMIVKKLNPCKKCGEKRYYVLDFHHTGGKKEGNISSLVKQGASLTRINNEILKCEILCANCHREVHHLERKLTG